MQQFFKRFRISILLFGCLLQLGQTTLVSAASDNACDPDNSVRRAKQIFRQTNDILYYDNCASSCSTGAATQMIGENNAERAYNYLVTHGYSPEQAAGIVGNMILESGVNPQRLQGTSLNDQTPADEAQGSPEGWGIVQWTPAGKMITPLKAAGKDPNDLTTQMEYLTDGNRLNGGARADAADRVRATSTVDDATQAFGQYYEAPADLGASIELRKTYAEAIYNKAKDGTPYPPEIEAAIYKGDGTGTASSQTGFSPCGSTRTDNGECQNPFRDLQNSYPMRWDGGLDYGGDNGEGPVYAVCPAEITHVQTSGSGWPGLGTEGSGAYITYKITAGKAKDLFVYLAEDCTPSVAVGDKVTTSQPICQYKQQGTYLEIGWSEGGNNQYIGWSDYPQKSNGYASNSGLDIGNFLGTLGVGEGHDSGEGISQTPPPADWPKW